LSSCGVSATGGRDQIYLDGGGSFNLQHETCNMKHLDLKIPETWNALTRKQLLYLCKLYRLNLTELKFKTWLFIKLTGIRALPREIIADQVYYIFKKGKTRFSLSVEELHWFLHSVDKFTHESHLTKNLFPKFTIFGKTFYGPSNSCYNVTVHEFLLAEAMLDAFHSSKDLKHLRLLTAILYRKQVKPYRPNSPHYTGDRRETFNDFTFQRRARWFRFLPKDKLQAVYVFFGGCRNAIVEKYPYLFNSTAVSSEKTNHIENLKNTLIALNQGDITKNKEILRSQVWEAFGQLNEMAKQVKSIKAKR
jgi:hypothetical protein